MMRKFKLSFLSSISIILFALGMTGHASWLLINSNASVSFELENKGDRAVCYNSSTNVSYTSLKRGLDTAKDGQEIVVYIGANAICSEDLTIRKNVTLTVPFLGKAFDAEKRAENIGNAPVYKIPDVDSRKNYGDTLGDANSSSVTKYRSALIQMTNGADIVNYGTLNLGGVCSTEGNNGYYSEINLQRGSSIRCKDGSIFECFGYVKENSADYVNLLNGGNGTYDNSADAERCVEIESGAKLTTSLAMYDAPSAGGLTMIINANQCPFWEWDIPNLQTYTKVNKGSRLAGVALLIGPSNLGISKEVTLFSPNTNEQSMFYLSSGYVGVEYLTSSPLYSSRNFNARQTNYYLNGNVDVGYVYAKEGNSLMSIELDTRNNFLPVSCRAHVVVGSGITLTTDKKIKFLAGSKLLIQENGKFNVNNQVIFHKQDSLILNTGAGIYYRYQGDGSIDASQLICNGSMAFNTDGKTNGAIGAYIEHTNSKGSASLNFNTLDDDTKLTVKDAEGSSDVVVLITSTGEFATETARFAKGNTYTSIKENNRYYWSGPSVSTREVKVNVLEGGTGSVVLYTLQYADDAGGTNLKDSDLLNSKSGGTVGLPSGKFAKLTLIRGQNATLKDSSGNIVSSSPEEFFKLDRDFTIDITPSETYSIDFIIAKDNDNVQMNGTGHFKLEIWESKTSNGTFFKVFDGKYGDAGKSVCQGSYFYLKRPFENPIYNYFKSANAEITKTPDVGAKPNWNVKSKEQSPTYFADANYSFKTYWTYTGGCFASGTPILMANGTYKNIEDIQYGDQILTWNFFKGTYEAQSLCILVDHGERGYEVTDLNFSNGATISLIADHGFFDYDLNKFVYLTSENWPDYLNHNFAYCNNSETERIKLIGARTYIETTHAYSLTSAFNYNAIVGGVLTAPPPGPFYNWVSMSGKMQYDTEEFDRNVARYGLYDYSAFEPYGVPYETFVAFNGPYLRIPVEKGIFSFEYIISLFNLYGGWITEQ